MEIFNVKLQGINIFEPEAIKFLCLKISMISSDVRLLLKISKKAIEIA